MALINCPECGKEISDKAESCPNCGCPKSEFYEVSDIDSDEDNYKENDSSNEYSDIYKTTFKENKQINKTIKMRKAFGITDLVIGILIFLMIITSNGKIIGNMRMTGVSWFFMCCGVLHLWGLRRKAITIICSVFYFLGILFNFIFSQIVSAHMAISILMIIYFILTVIGLKDPESFTDSQTNQKCNYQNNKNMFWGIISLGFLSFIFFTATGFLNERKYENINSKNIMNYSDFKNKTTENTPSAKTNNKAVIESTITVNPKPEKTLDPQMYEDVFFYTLMDNPDTYNGKYVRTVIQVYRCYQTENEAYIQSQYSDYDIAEKSNDIKVYPDNYQDFEFGEYVTIEGRLGKDGNKNILANAHIVGYGENSQSAFENNLSIYVTERNQKLQMEKESFIENCISVSYDELRKYPDSYKDVPIVLTIHVKDVEPDGWIFPGDIIATFEGEKIAAYDDRTVREPRIVQSDTITVYAIGNGLVTMKVTQKGLVFSKTVDEYEVPSIKIKYTENDRDY